jgi:hypothetical protein
VDIRQIRPNFVFMPQKCILQDAYKQAAHKDAAFGLTKNDPHPSRRRLRSLV